MPALRWHLLQKLLPPVLTAATQQTTHITDAAAHRALQAGKKQ